MGQFNVTSLKPVNPDNAPDDFERRSLLKFADGATEAIEIEKVDGSYRLRYMAPLKVDSRCLECHAKQGYALGDIRGGMNVTVPMNWAYAEIRANNRMLLGIALATIVLVSLCLYLLFNSLVARRLEKLAAAMDRYPEQPLDNNFLAHEPDDEIGLLSRHFHKLCQRLETSQKELDETREQVFQSEKLAALGRLVAGISHEINNPLGGMQNCIQTMERNMDRPELQNRYLALLSQGIEKIKGTVQQLLNIGRNEPLDIKPGDIDQVIRDCLELSCIGRNNIVRDLNLHVNRPVTTGIEALRQVIMNLAGNAVHAIGDENGTIKVSSWLDDGSLFIEMTDSGSGIAPDHLDNIFEPFFTTKEVGQGTGLGLSISHSLVEQLDGKITVTNSSAGGACFTLRIPLQNGDE
jgi:signal transduction histidine kinase